MRSATQISTKIGIMSLTLVLRDCFVCPQNVSLPTSIWLYSVNIAIFFYILKVKSIQAFMNGNTCKFYAWSLVQVNDQFCARSRVTRTSSLTCSKDCATNCYSLSNYQWCTFSLNHEQCTYNKVHLSTKHDSKEIINKKYNSNFFKQNVIQLLVLAVE